MWYGKTKTSLARLAFVCDTIELLGGLTPVCYGRGVLSGLGIVGTPLLGRGVFSGLGIVGTPLLGRGVFSGLGIVGTPLLGRGVLSGLGMVGTPLANDIAKLVAATAMTVITIARRRFVVRDIVELLFILRGEVVGRSEIIYNATRGAENFPGDSL